MLRCNIVFIYISILFVPVSGTRSGLVRPDFSMTRRSKSMQPSRPGAAKRNPVFVGLKDALKTKTNTVKQRVSDSMLKHVNRVARASKKALGSGRVSSRKRVEDTKLNSAPRTRKQTQRRADGKLTSSEIPEPLQRVQRRKPQQRRSTKPASSAFASNKGSHIPHKVRKMGGREESHPRSVYYYGLLPDEHQFAALEEEFNKARNRLEEDLGQSDHIFSELNADNAELRAKERVLAELAEQEETDDFLRTEALAKTEALANADTANADRRNSLGSTISTSSDESNRSSVFSEPSQLEPASCTRTDNEPVDFANTDKYVNNENIKRSMIKRSMDDNFSATVEDVQNSIKEQCASLLKELSAPPVGLANCVKDTPNLRETVRTPPANDLRNKETSSRECTSCPPKKASGSPSFNQSAKSTVNTAKRQSAGSTDKLNKRPCGQLKRAEADIEAVKRRRERILAADNARKNKAWHI